jgi:tight adherence protein B
MMPALALLSVTLLVAGPPQLGRARLRWLARNRIATGAGLSSAAGPGLSSAAGAGASGRPWPAIGGGVGLRAPVPTAIAVALVSAVAGSVIAFALGPVPGALTALTAWTVLGAVRTLHRERHREQELADLERAVTALVDEYTAGASTAAALSAAATSAGAFRPALSRAGALTAAGSEPEAALPALAGLTPLRVACATVSRTGAQLSEVLRGVRLDLAADRATSRAVRAAMAGPRASAVLLAALPLVGLAMGQAIGAHPARTLLHTGPGLGSLCLGVCLDLAGLRWTLALTRTRIRR